MHGHGHVIFLGDLVEKVNAKKIELKITLKHEGLNVDVNPCVESRHVPHGRVLCFVWALDIYI